MTITLNLPTAQATPDKWWTCPDWCAGGEACYGGDTFDFGGYTVLRRHTGDLVNMVTDGHDGCAPQRIRVVAERCDSPDTGPGPVRRILHVELADRPQHLDRADIDAQLDGMDRAGRDSIAANHLAGTWAAQSAYLPADAITAIVAALTGPVA